MPVPTTPRGTPPRPATAAEPHKVSRDGGERLTFSGMEVVIRASAESTAGAFSVVEEIHPIDVPPHVHHDHDEIFYVLEGEHVITVGDRRIEAGPGDLVFGPRGVPHSTSRVVSRVGRVLALFSPSGFEGFFRGLAELDAEGNLHQGSLGDLARRYGASWV